MLGHLDLVQVYEVNTYLEKSLLIYDLQCKDGINIYYMLKGFLRTCRPPNVSHEMKCTNEK